MPRTPCRRPVSLQFETDPETIEAVTTDISADGMFVETARLREPGTSVVFRLMIEGRREPIEGTAEVVRVQGGDESERVAGMGMRFIELPDAVAAALRALVRAHGKDPDED